MVPSREEASDRILAGLAERTPAQVELALRAKRGDHETAIASLPERRDNYEAAERALLEWCGAAFRAAGIPEDEAPGPNHPDPRARAAWEIRYWVHPLLWAYADTKRFFCEIAPQIDSNHLFDSDKLIPGPYMSHGTLAETLYTWGPGALLNPSVRAAFDKAAESSEEFSRILAYAEGKEAYVEGPPPGKTKGKPKRRRVDNLSTKNDVYKAANDYEEQTGAPRGGCKVAIKMIARREGISPEGVRKRMKRARPKK
jgi:hypothetical protein